MDMLRQLNLAIGYIEENLFSEPSAAAAARIACISTDSFLRFFSYITGMSLAEYMRRRRLTQAAEILRRGGKVIDVALMCGYDSAAAFSRAFSRQHGITPSEYRSHGGTLRVYPPASFHITVKGAREMELRFFETEGFEVWGISRDAAGYASREELRHEMWSEERADIPGRLCEGSWNQPGSNAYDGEWYGIWSGGRYMLARRDDRVKSGEYERYTVPAGTYAVFSSEKGALAWEALPRLFEQVFEAWLPASGYRQKSDIVIETYHLWTEHGQRSRERYYELMIPVEAI